MTEQQEASVVMEYDAILMAIYSADRTGVRAALQSIDDHIDFVDFVGYIGTYRAQVRKVLVEMRLACIERLKFLAAAWYLGLVANYKNN